MKAFDLERAKAGDPVMTRDGKDVRIICFDRNYGDYQILALLKADDGREVDTYAYNNEGIWVHDNGEDSDKTLVMKPKKKVYHYAIYKIGESYNATLLYSSKEYIPKHSYQEILEYKTFEIEE